MTAKLRPLPYPYSALEPTISRRTLEFHHDEHHASYVKGWNEGEELLQRTRGTATPGMLRGAYEGLAFNGAGIILHELYWDNLCPLNASPPPSPELVSCMNRCFGSMNQMVNEMASIGSVIRGSGWIVLAWSARFGRMVLLPISNHENGWIPGVEPLLVIDVWEHAYYLDYQSARKRYLQLIWHNVNWGVVSDRYAEATEAR